jgi:hypothetical protein
MCALQRPHEQDEVLFLLGRELPAMKCTWLPRSRMLTPFFVAMTGSPST